MLDLLIAIVDTLIWAFTPRTPGMHKTPWLAEMIYNYFKDCFSYEYVSNHAFSITVKLSICLVFLSAIKGGVPRYRYDFLTKMGWVKFLGLMLSVFLLVFLLFTVW